MQEENETPEPAKDQPEVLLPSWDKSALENKRRSGGATFLGVAAVLIVITLLIIWSPWNPPKSDAAFASSLLGFGFIFVVMVVVIVVSLIAFVLSAADQIRKK
jgi:hypothetical protein